MIWDCPKMVDASQEVRDQKMEEMQEFANGFWELEGKLHEESCPYHWHVWGNANAVFNMLREANNWKGVPDEEYEWLRVADKNLRLLRYPPRCTCL